VLGLRAGEVAAITLDDIDWRAGTLAIPTCKSRRGTRLPLPAQVAVALADYLQRGRPATTERAVFVHHRAPRGARGKASLIRIAVRRAYARAGLDPRLTVTHVLRHTAATRLLRAGASMKEIAEEKSLRKTGTVVEVDHPTRGKYLTVGNPVKMSDSLTEVKRSPLLGEHTEEILRKELG